MPSTEEREKQSSASRSGFPTKAGIFLGLGLGGFFDGIVLHHILQWHHMATSAGYPPDSLENLKFNTLLDGLFHASTYVLVMIGLLLLWQAAHRGAMALQQSSICWAASRRGRRWICR